MLSDLYNHMEWADAEHWRAVENFPSALEDKIIRERLHHIHLVQHAYLWIVSEGGNDFKRTAVDDFYPITELKNYAREFHTKMAEFQKTLTESKLYLSVNIPWYKDPPLSVPVIQALTQAVMHSQYHRGQNATRLRELGGEPPLTDYIAWYWKGKPKAGWS